MLPITLEVIGDVVLSVLSLGTPVPVPSGSVTVSGSSEAAVQCLQSVCNVDLSHATYEMCSLPIDKDQAR